MARLPKRSVETTFICPRLLLLGAALFVMMSTASLAEPIPYDGCLISEEYQIKTSGGPELSGDWNVLMCESETWVPIFSWDSGLQETRIAGGRVSIGGGNASAGSQSFSWGGTASGYAATAWGETSTASGSYSTAFGSNTTASDEHSTAWGTNSQSSNLYTTAFGVNTTASGENSTAWGTSSHAGSYLETSLGRFPLDTPGTPAGWVATDTLFEIGNGASSGSRANAVTVLKNGNAGIGTASPQSTLHVPDGKYLQVEDNNAGAPPTADCDNNAERGRISLDTSNNRIYVCMGAARGWDYATLSD